MATTPTTNYSLLKHAKGDPDWHTAMNDNLDDIDTQMKTNADAASAAQSTANAKGWKKYTISATVDVVADDTFVGSGFAITIPADSVLQGFLIKGEEPGGTAGGDQTVQIAVGTVQNADGDLSDATDYDVMVASGDKTAAFAHGDEASDHDASYFAMDMHAKYFDSETTLYLNYIGKASGATGTPGTVTCAITAWALMEQLS